MEAYFITITDYIIGMMLVALTIYFIYFYYMVMITGKIKKGDSIFTVDEIKEERKQRKLIAENEEIAIYESKSMYFILDKKEGEYIRSKESDTGKIIKLLKGDQMVFGYVDNRGILVKKENTLEKAYNSITKEEAELICDTVALDVIELIIEERICNEDVKESLLNEIGKCRKILMKV
jgi:hypothetical protein